MIIPPEALAAYSLVYRRAGHLRPVLVDGAVHEGHTMALARATFGLPRFAPVILGKPLGLLRFLPLVSVWYRP